MITYRDGTPNDAAALNNLARTTFIETFGHLYAPHDLGAFLERHTPRAYREDLSDPAFAIRFALDDGEPIGFAKLGPPSLPFEPAGRPIELRQFYVLKPWHGTEVARDLMDWVLATARARRADEVWLSVFTSNHRARRFYERYGFRFVQPYTFMVGNHADEDHILRLDLNQTAVVPAKAGTPMR